MPMGDRIGGGCAMPVHDRMGRLRRTVNSFGNVSSGIIMAKDLLNHRAWSLTLPSRSSWDYETAPAGPAVAFGENFRNVADHAVQARNLIISARLSRLRNAINSGNTPPAMPVRETGLSLDPP